MIQAGYYTLKTLEGMSNGYVCLTYIGNQMEVRIRVDQTSQEERTYKGYFTPPFATIPQEPCVLTLSSGGKGASCLGAGTLATQSLPTETTGVDFTLFCQNRPCMVAQIVLPPEPKPEPEIETAPTIESEPENEPDEEAQSEPALQADAEMEPENEIETDSEMQEAPETAAKVHALSAPYNLQEFDPFNTTNTAYKWWVCTHTDQFYQLMEDTEIVPDPPLYTTLSSALTRFGHFLFGRYQEDPEDGRILFIFGVPVSASTPVPSQINARWIPAQNKIAGNLNYAGYWLYYFDAVTKHHVRAKLRA